MDCIKKAADHAFSPSDLPAAFANVGMWPLDPKKVYSEEVNKGAGRTAKDVDLQLLADRAVPAMRKDLKQPTIIQGTLSTAAARQPDGAGCDHRPREIGEGQASQGRCAGAGAAGESCTGGGEQGHQNQAGRCSQGGQVWEGVARCLRRRRGGGAPQIEPGKPVSTQA